MEKKEFYGAYIPDVKREDADDFFDENAVDNFIYPDYFKGEWEDKDGDIKMVYVSLLRIEDHNGGRYMRRIQSKSFCEKGEDDIWKCRHNLLSQLHFNAYYYSTKSGYPINESMDNLIVGCDGDAVHVLQADDDERSELERMEIRANPQNA